MGSEMQTHIFLGCCVDPKLFVRKEKAFPHSYSERFLYDPATGRPLWREIDALEALVDRHGLEVLRLPAYPMAYVGKSLAVATAVPAADKPLTILYPHGLDNFPDIEDAVKKRLRAGGLLSNATFGLWTIVTPAPPALPPAGG